MNCELCKHWSLIPLGGGMGECRRYPPEIVVLMGPGGPQPATLFPQTDKKVVCGEYTGKVQQ